MKAINYTTNNPVQYRPIEDDRLSRALYSFISGKSKNTATNYRVSIQQFIDFIGGDYNSILLADPMTIIKFKEHLLTTQSISTVSARLSAVSSLYNYLMRNELMEKNPVLLIDRKDLKVNPYERSKTLTMEQFNTILKSIPDSMSGIRDRIIFQMIYVSGLRRSAIQNLTGKDIQFFDGMVYFKVTLKGGSVTTKELPTPVWEQILGYC